MIRAFALLGLALVAACAPAAPPAGEAAPPAPAEWTLVSGDSRIAFASIKAGDIIETHYFPSLEGSISADGEARVDILLDAVETKIDIRDERMREMFFETGTYPRATLTAAIDQSAFADMGVGERRVAMVTGTLSLHGQSLELDVPAFITRIAADRVEVESAEPVVIFVDDFDLGAGLEQLRQVANLPSITPSTPVTFTLVFEGSGRA